MKTIVPPSFTRLRFDEFDHIGSGFPDRGEGLESITSINECTSAGFGFDDGGQNLIGWRGSDRYSLSLRDSIEFYVALNFAAENLVLSVSWDCVNLRWLFTQILVAIPQPDVFSE